MKLLVEIKRSSWIYKYESNLFVDDKKIKSFDTDLLWIARLWAWYHINFFRPDEKPKTGVIKTMEKER